MQRRKLLAMVGGTTGALAGCTELMASSDPGGDDGEPANTGTSRDGDPGTVNSDDGPDLDASADFTISSMSPLEGYLVSARIEPNNADEVLIFYNGNQIMTVQSGGNVRIAGDEEDDGPLHFEEVEFGDSFQAIAVYDDEGITQEIAADRPVS